jgi:molybdopterin-guanine dinucleotide biosynthesis protein A
MASSEPSPKRAHIDVERLARAMYTTEFTSKHDPTTHPLHGVAWEDLEEPLRAIRRQNAARLIAAYHVEPSPPAGADPGVTA